MIPRRAPFPALAYYNPVYHARRIKAGTQVHLIANFGDYSCPPSGVWVVYNSIPHDNKPKPWMVFHVNPAGYEDAVQKE